MVKNVLGFDEFIEETSLNEGLIMSYPADNIQPEWIEKIDEIKL